MTDWPSEEWYVYKGEGDDAISVAYHGTGPNGGWVGVSLARMSLPDKHKSRRQINAAAQLMRSAPDLYEALRYARRFLKPEDHDTAFVDAALAKARGETQ